MSQPTLAVDLKVQNMIEAIWLQKGKYIPITINMQ